MTRRTMSRRRLLQAVPAAVAAPYVLTSTALGAGGTTPASQRITIGFIGVGNMGKGHVGRLSSDKRVQILAICDCFKKKRDEQANLVEGKYAKNKPSATYKGVDRYNDFREMLARDDIDAVLIATPEHWHAIPAIEACRAGKDVYCEKPLSHTVREARAMVNAARRYGRVFQTGSQQRSSSNFRLACELVRNGRIGKVERIAISIGDPSEEKYFPTQPVPEGLDWDRWLGPAPWAPYNSERASGSYGGGWRKVREYSGGMTTDWGAHHFDIAQWGMGMDQSGPVEFFPAGGEFEFMTSRYANGVIMERRSGNGVEFYGTKGSIYVNRGKLSSKPANIIKEPIGPDEIHLYNSGNHHANWLDCIETRRRPICDVEVGCRTISVCHLYNIAHWLKRPIKWDPVKEEIIGDEEASRMLVRPMRSPWHL